MFHTVMHWIAVAAVAVALIVAAAYEGSSLASRIRSARKDQVTESSVTETKETPRIWTTSAITVLVIVALTAIFWRFVLNHPGVVLVFFGVVGENIWDEKDGGGKKAAYTVSAIVLIFGLVVEMHEAVEDDKKLTDAKTALAKLEQENLKLREDQERLRPENTPIKSMRADVSLRVRGIPEFMGDDSLIKSLCGLHFDSAEGGFGRLECSRFDFREWHDGSRKQIGGFYTLTFDWPAPEDFPGLTNLMWLGKGHTPTEFDAKLTSIIGAFSGLTESCVVEIATCIITINGVSQRNWCAKEVRPEGGAMVGQFRFVPVAPGENLFNWDFDEHFKPKNGERK